MIKDSYGNTRFFGTYRGVVFDTNDPIGRNRLRLKVPQILGEFPTEWAWPVVAPGAGFTLPSIGDGIWVQFEGGDASFPIWVGTFDGVETGLSGGAVGPTGPAGTSGTNGTNGTDGTNGTNGDTGPQGPAGIASATSPITVTGPTGAQTIGIDQSAIAISASQVTSGLSGTYAPLASPPLTGTPTAPTADPGTSTTQLATTAFVQGAIPADFSYKSTYYYETHHGQLSFSGNSSVANKLWFHPCLITSDVTISAIAIRVSSSTSGSTARIGIYADNGAGEPGTLVLDAGTVSTATTGAKSITGLSTTLTKGVYWFCVWHSASGVALYQYNIPSNGETLTYIGNSGSFTSQQQTGYTFSTVTYPTAYPTTFPTATWSADAYAARVQILVA